MPSTLRITARTLSALLVVACLWFAATPDALAQAGVCPRFPAGSTVTEPVALYSAHGVLEASLTYNMSTDNVGNPVYCFLTADGQQSPTFHLRPGDLLKLSVHNRLPAPTKAAMTMALPADAKICGASEMNSSSVNLHYHGLNISPQCGADEVLNTIVNSGESFTYQIQLPSDEPPGLYWYHPHIHGFAEAQVLGGASGAIIVDGIESIQPAVAGLPQRLLIPRDSLTPGGRNGDAPGKDISLNYIPITYPAYTPASITVRAGQKEFWRVANMASDTILDVALIYDGQRQALQLVGLDGVPTGSQLGTRQGKLVPVQHIVLPPAGRAEFIMTTPSTDVKKAVFATNTVLTGPDGDSVPSRPMALLKVSDAAAPVAPAVVVVAPWKQRFEGLGQAKVDTNRLLYFSEDNPNGLFYVTVQGQKPVLFNAKNPPAITTTQGAVEEWVIQNRALEHHEFHIHQIHFLVESQNNFELNGTPQSPGINGQLLDTIQIPYWDGNPKHPYPSVTVRMDFRGPITGDFVYHCHILEHEDKGMMAIIRVNQSSDSAKAATPGKE